MKSFLVMYSEKKPAPAKEPVPQPAVAKVEEKKEKKKKPSESASFIESEKSAIKGEGLFSPCPGIWWSCFPAKLT